MIFQLANIIALGVGASIGWSSPFLPLLQSENSPLSEPITSEEASWIGSILALGALVGTLLFGWLSEAVGRFWASILTSIPQIVRIRFFNEIFKSSLIYLSKQLWWVSVIVGSSVEFLLVGRFLAGLAAGGVFVLVPLYVSEIAEDKVRGILGSFFIFSINFGTLIMFVAGNYLSYSLVPRIMISFPIIFALTFVFMPESPQHLLKCGKAEHAEKSLKFLRGCRDSKELPEKVKSDLLEMSNKIDEDNNLKGKSIIAELSE